MHFRSDILAEYAKADAYSQARQILESLVGFNHSFGSLLFNLSTVYELCSDKAGILKTSLAESVAKQPISGDLNLDRPSADFKL